ncbi:MAG: hypothetical protein Q9M50_05980 [Methylococcales bacterium]|nr:hypothetical protein [Methylococcales bacterium]
MIFIHSLAAFASVYHDLSGAGKLLSFGGVILSGLFYYHDYKKFQPYYIRYSSKVKWQLAKTETNFQTITILPTTVLTAQFIVLHFYLDGSKKQSLILVRDALKNTEFKILLVALKISGLTSAK